MTAPFSAELTRFGQAPTKRNSVGCCSTQQDRAVRRFNAFWQGGRIKRHIGAISAAAGVDLFDGQTSKRDFAPVIGQRHYNAAYFVPRLSQLQVEIEHNRRRRHPLTKFVDQEVGWFGLGFVVAQI